jgi:hypothetical protein
MYYDYFQFLTIFESLIAIFLRSQQSTCHNIFCMCVCMFVFLYFFHKGCKTHKTIVNKQITKANLFKNKKLVY